MKLKSMTVILCVFIFVISAKAQERIVFGVSSVISAGKSITMYEELNQYISRQMNIRSDIVHKSNYTDMNKLIEGGDVSFASVCSGAIPFLDPKSYRLLAVPVVKGKSTYNSYLIVNKHRNINSLSDLKGKKIAFTDKISNSGTMYPIYFFRKNGIDIQNFFKHVYFTGSHDKSIYLVNKGVVDAAAVDSLVYEHAGVLSSANTANTKIIHVSEDFPIPPFIVSTSMNKDLQKRIKVVLTEMHMNREGKEILKHLHIERFVDAAGMDYSVLSEMKKEIDALSENFYSENF